MIEKVASARHLNKSDPRSISRNIKYNKMMMKSVPAKPKLINKFNISLNGILTLSAKSLKMLSEWPSK
ncbi:hypothetical protein GCM10017764_18500 [Sphingobacterium griseoflavum]|uniref:Uncharacterized protein n=1 Tax=Sphingobacterium griseoflavum TaxID=1474952 RepID=A0ABQ3HZG4_9SPHI|nr:hypothetical protein GCM10017764_18500 [Sphingobacterium griseoflavum]